MSVIMVSRGNLYWGISLTVKCEDKLLPASVVVNEYVFAANQPYSKLVAYSLRLKPKIFMLEYGPCAL